MKNVLDKKFLKNLRNDKESAIERIDLSIKKWEEANSKNNFIALISSFKKSKNIILHWEKISIIKNLYKIDLLWTNKSIRHITNVKKEQVLTALQGIKIFYTKISTLKPDLTHPDILECCNLTAISNSYKTIKSSFKETIEINLLDPFADVLGIEGEKIEKTLHLHKKKALQDIDFSLIVFKDSIKKFKQIKKSTVDEPKNYTLTVNNKFDLQLIWCNEVVKHKKKLPKKDVEKNLLLFKKIIHSFNIKRPNLKDLQIKKMYEISLQKKNLIN